jgi:hypothetical protein
LFLAKGLGTFFTLSSLTPDCIPEFVRDFEYAMVELIDAQLNAHQLIHDFISSSFFVVFAHSAHSNADAFGEQRHNFLNRGRHPASIAGATRNVWLNPAKS